MSQALTYVGLEIIKAEEHPKDDTKIIIHGRRMKNTLETVVTARKDVALQLFGVQTPAALAEKTCFLGVTEEGVSAMIALTESPEATQRMAVTPYHKELHTAKDGVKGVHLDVEG